IKTSPYPGLSCTNSRLQAASLLMMGSGTVEKKMRYFWSFEIRALRSISPLVGAYFILISAPAKWLAQLSGERGGQTTAPLLSIASPSMTVTGLGNVIGQEINA